MARLLGHLEAAALDTSAAMAEAAALVVGSDTAGAVGISCGDLVVRTPHNMEYPPRRWP